MRKILLALALCGASTFAIAQEAEPPMTMSRMGEILLALDPDARSNGTSIEMSVEGIPVLVIADAAANRMRMMVPIRSADGMTREELQRVMQANFDSALDARYAIAQGRLWCRFLGRHALTFE